MSLAGLSVAFPLGVGLALVLGVVVNYVGAPKGDPAVLFLGVALIVVAIICNGIASGRMRKSGDSAAQKPQRHRAGRRGGRADVVLLPVRRRGDGPRQLRGPARPAC